MAVGGAAEAGADSDSGADVAAAEEDSDSEGSSEVGGWGSVAVETEGLEAGKEIDAEVEAAAWVFVLAGTFDTEGVAEEGRRRKGRYMWMVSFARKREGGCF